MNFDINKLKYFSIFEIADFDGLITYLDYIMRKNLSLNIIQSLCRADSKEKIDSLEKVQKLLKLIQPLISDSEDAVEEDNYTFENNQSEVCKMIYIVKTEDPETTFQIYEEFKNIFINGGEKRKKVTLPALANCIILFCHKLSVAYDNKNDLISEEMKKNNYVKESIGTYDISKLENGEALGKLSDKQKEDRKKKKEKMSLEQIKKLEYLEIFKKILDLDNTVEPEGKKLISLLEIIDKDDYVITTDNFRKMILILYRIIANIPVILMGETGCGKTALIKKLNQLLNNGEENLESINIDPSYDDEKLTKTMNEINKKAKKL